MYISIYCRSMNISLLGEFIYRRMFIYCFGAIIEKFRVDIIIKYNAGLLYERQNIQKCSGVLSLFRIRVVAELIHLLLSSGGKMSNLRYQYQ